MRRWFCPGVSWLGACDGCALQGLGSSCLSVKDRSLFCVKRRADVDQNDVHAPHVGVHAAAEGECFLLQVRKVSWSRLGCVEESQRGLAWAGVSLRRWPCCVPALVAVPCPCAGGCAVSLCSAPCRVPALVAVPCPCAQRWPGWLCRGAEGAVCFLEPCSSGSVWQRAVLRRGTVAVGLCGVQQ